jgi:hypothetical protein
MLDERPSGLLQARAKRRTEGSGSRATDAPEGAASCQRDFVKGQQILGKRHDETFGMWIFWTLSNARFPRRGSSARSSLSAKSRPHVTGSETSRASHSLGSQTSCRPAQKNQCMISDFAKNFAWRMPPTLRNRANRPHPIRTFRMFRCRVWPSTMHSRLADWPYRPWLSSPDRRTIRAWSASVSPARPCPDWRR